MSTCTPPLRPPTTLISSSSAQLTLAERRPPTHSKVPSSACGHPASTSSAPPTSTGGGSQQETGTSYAAGMVSGLHGSEPCAISGTGHSAHSGRCQEPHHGRSLTSRETRGGSRGGVSSGGFERLGVSPLR